jgi:hypothetical protein
MDIDNVLLNIKEIDKARGKGWDKARKEGKTFGDSCKECDIAERKAQCLKLLKVLGEPCEHTLYAGAGRTIRRVTRLIDCPVCMSELKKFLGGE